MIKIKEVIVVEGIKDEIAVKRSVDAEVIYVSGFGISNKTIKLIKNAQERCGVILFMDSDSAGERIRNIISSKDIGVENASPEDILESIKNAKCVIEYKRNEFNMGDLIENNLVNTQESSKRRELLGDILGIGYANGKKFLARLNYFNISREQFLCALEKLKEILNDKY